jgi:hypothetical protein
LSRPARTTAIQPRPHEAGEPKPSRRFGALAFRFCALAFGVCKSRLITPVLAAKRTRMPLPSAAVPMQLGRHGLSGSPLIKMNAARTTALLVFRRLDREYCLSVGRRHSRCSLSNRRSRQSRAGCAVPAIPAPRFPADTACACSHRKARAGSEGCRRRRRAPQRCPSSAVIRRCPSSAWKGSLLARGLARQRTNHPTQGGASSWPRWSSRRPVKRC